jgi:hypothetical protein
MPHDSPPLNPLAFVAFPAVELQPALLVPSSVPEATDQPRGAWLLGVGSVLCELSFDALTQLAGIDHEAPQVLDAQLLGRVPQAAGPCAARIAATCAQRACSPGSRIAGSPPALSCELSFWANERLPTVTYGAPTSSSPRSPSTCSRWRRPPSSRRSGNLAPLTRAAARTWGPKWPRAPFPPRRHSAAAPSLEHRPHGAAELLDRVGLQQRGAEAVRPRP